MIEIDRGLVPIEDLPDDTAQVFFYSKARQPDEERAADAPFAERRPDIEIFQIDAGTALPSGVVIEVQGEPGGLVVPFRDDAVKTRLRPETVAEKIGFGGANGVRLALIFSQFPYEREDEWDVGGFGRSKG